MTDSNQRWDRVGEAITARVAELGMSKAELERASGISPKTLTIYMNGGPIIRADKARGLCAALSWTIDSIDRILDGGAPIVNADPAGTEAAILRDPLLTAIYKDRLIQIYREAVRSSR